jgi:hypothetical protein
MGITCARTCRHCGWNSNVTGTQPLGACLYDRRQRHRSVAGYTSGAVLRLATAGGVGVKNLREAREKKYQDAEPRRPAHGTS